MAHDITEKILKNLQDSFFGEEYFKYVEIVDSVLACRSLKDFRHLKLDLKSPEFETVFKIANYKPEEKNAITQARAEQIFAQVKPVKAASTFI